MSVIRVKKHLENYVILHKEILENPEISLKSKGLWAFCMAKPDDWEFHVEQLEKTLKEGEKALYSALEELIEFGYVVRVQGKGKKGQFETVDYEIFETTKLKKCLPHRPFGDADNGRAEKEELLRNDFTKTEAKASLTTTVKKKDCSSEKKVEERVLPESVEGSQLECTRPDGIKQSMLISDIYRSLMPMNYTNSEIVEAIKIARTTQYIGDIIRFLQGTIENRRAKYTPSGTRKPSRYIPGDDNEYKYKGETKWIARKPK